jgi:antagonist of KipI
VPTVKVIEPGMLTTVQDLGRPGHASIGVPLGGAADPLALRAVNRLLGNDEGAAALECTLLGPTVSFDRDTVVAITGAVPTADTPKAWVTTTVRAGEPLRMGSLTDGARAYLCIAGGIRVPRTLGSASTLLSAAFGGHQGRALKAGDQLQLGVATGRAPDTRIADALRREYTTRANPRTLRATDGPHQHLLDPAHIAAFWAATFTISNQSNRVGIRLDGAAIPAPNAAEMVSEGAFPGAIQLTPSGQPIVLCVDHPTTGGYPIIASVASVDLHLLGQLRPGDKVRFERTTLDHARRAFIQREHAWSTNPQ